VHFVSNNVFVSIPVKVIFSSGCKSFGGLHCSRAERKEGTHSPYSWWHEGRLRDKATFLVCSCSPQTYKSSTRLQFMWNEVWNLSRFNLYIKCIYKFVKNRFNNKRLVLQEISSLAEIRVKSLRCWKYVSVLYFFTPTCWWDTVMSFLVAFTYLTYYSQMFVIYLQFI
jgi:hypothetical protein